MSSSVACQLLNDGAGWITDSFIAFKQDHTAAFISRSKIVSGMVEFNRGDNVGLGYIFDITFVTKALGELPSRSSLIGFNHLS